jgi:hypothetical protein
LRIAKDPLVVDHKDRGCKAFDVCLKCPLPRCCMDPVPRDATALTPLSRAIEIVNLRNQNWLIREIAACYKVSDRTVYRALRSQTFAELNRTAAPSGAPAPAQPVRRGVPSGAPAPKNVIASEARQSVPPPKMSLRGARRRRGNLSPTKGINHA